MKSVVLFPYCPWPANSGTNVELFKHLEVLKELGTCCIASARSRPVGGGWTPEAIKHLKEQGYEIVLREDAEKHWTAGQWVGMAYAAVMKSLRLEQTFGHGNPYHRYAYTSDWWQRITRDADLAVINYTFSARLPSKCPKVIVTHEVMSSHHWGGNKLEMKELGQADLVIVVGKEEEEQLKSCGVKNVLWSPPVMHPMDLPVSPKLCLLGSDSNVNISALRWLEEAVSKDTPPIHVYGGLARSVRSEGFVPVGRYEDRYDPYRECGIHLMARSEMPGLQIKVVEALACGRAIVARKGSMRGLPPEPRAYIEVNSPDEMMAAAISLSEDENERLKLSARAKSYYHKYLDSKKVLSDLKDAYCKLIRL